MKVIVISYPFKTVDEIEIISELFEAGLDTFHFRKPDYKFKEFQNALNKIPEKYHEKIVIHSHYQLCEKMNFKGIHIPGKIRQSLIEEREYDKLNKYRIISTSFHDLHVLIDDKEIFEYVFLSPVFDSISKINYFSAFNFNDISIALSKIPNEVIALGGVNILNINQAAKMGFKGVALLGVVWKSKNPVKTYFEINKLCKQIEISGL
jgi:thiamine-phosphate pyrophosphorylase